MLGHEYLEASGLSHNQVEALGFKDNTDLSVEELIKIFKTLKSIADSRAALNDLENISEDPLLSIKSAREVLGKIRTIQALNQGWVTMQGKGIFKINMRIIKSSEIVKFLYCPKSLNFNNVKEQVYTKEKDNSSLILIIIGAICLLLLLKLL